ncbi:MAG: hypothetical protein JXR84_03315 [Anaerolineae bacterium]|nr:hypothetical protein [Anaerolineae bacterium]
MNELLKKVSEFLAHNKGLPVLIGISMVLLNLVFNLLPQWAIIAWLADTELFLHLGVILGLFGILLGDAL